MSAGHRSQFQPVEPGHLGGPARRQAARHGTGDGGSALPSSGATPRRHRSIGHHHQSVERGVDGRLVETIGDVDELGDDGQRLAGSELETVEACALQQASKIGATPEGPPTVPTSPSSMAFTACVVECVTSWCVPPRPAATSAVTRTTPAAGPRARCEWWAAPIGRSPAPPGRAIALVKVPPTSTPILIWDGAAGCSVASGTGEFESAAAPGTTTNVHAADV